MLPPLSLYGKDHKPDIDIEKGPKRRPVVSANEGPNARVSELVAQVLNKAADAEDSKYECPSTEAMQANVEALNKRLQDEAFNVEVPNDERKLEIGNLDFIAWYTNFKVDVVVKVIRKRLEKGPATINVCDIELSRFLFFICYDER